jgi:hypothetical protein
VTLSTRCIFTGVISKTCTINTSWILSSESCRERLSLPLLLAWHVNVGGICFQLHHHRHSPLTLLPSGYLMLWSHFPHSDSMHLFSSAILGSEQRAPTTSHPPEVDFPYCGFIAFSRSQKVPWLRMSVGCLQRRCLPLYTILDDRQGRRTRRRPHPRTRSAMPSSPIWRAARSMAVPAVPSASSSLILPTIFKIQQSRWLTFKDHSSASLIFARSS